MAMVGSIVFVAAHAVSVTFRDARMDDPAGRAAITLFAIGSLLTSVGFILAGLAVARAGQWTAWRRYPVLAVGVWMLCMLPLQFTSLLRSRSRSMLRRSLRSRSPSSASRKVASNEQSVPTLVRVVGG